MVDAGSPKEAGAPAVETLSQAETQSFEAASTFVQMWSGEALTLEGVADLARDGNVVSIFLAGMPNSGKTTLLAAFYEKFRRGPLAGHLFAGSRTLVRFEDVCHYARLASGGGSPATERTRRRQNIELVHLRTTEPERSEFVDLVLTDISGELFQQIRDSTEEAKRLGVVSRFHTFALFLDAALLLDPSSRQATLRDNRQILQSFKSAQVLRTVSHVDLVLSKADLLLDAEEKHQQFVEDAIEELMRTIDTDSESIRSWKVAARPPAGYEAGFGVNELFKFWTREDRISVDALSEIYSDQEESELAFRVSRFDVGGAKR